ncbi:MAG: beta-N-acetylhexosaminidase [Spirochaetia bacterium]|nr:beta-N-acetylhexosaminidase [Spirochaetia bacterium]
MNWNTLIPAPLHIEQKKYQHEGTFPLSSQVTIFSEHAHIAENFARLMANDFKLMLKINLDRSATELESEYTAASLPFILLQNNRDLQTEEYSIRISPGGIKIQAGDRLGFIHAYHTIKQYLLALPLSQDKAEAQVFRLQCAVITDRPAVQWRGAMLDVSRHLFPVAFILHFIDLLALHHLNIFHWHLTDDQGWRIGVPGYPKLLEVAAWRDDMTTESGRYGGYYTEQDIKKVIEHASHRGVTVVPEIDLPGHVSAAIAAYPELSCRKEAIEVPVRHGIYEDVLCAGTPAVYTFIEALVRKVCRLFPSDYLHLGGDECPTARWKECPACGEVMQQHGLHKPQDLQGLLMNYAVQIAEEYDKKIIAWDEVLAVNPDFRPITAVWRDVRYIKDAVATNLQVVVSPSQTGTYLDNKHLDDPNEPGRLGVSTVKDVYTLDIFKDLSDREREFILGGQGNLWTEEIKYGRQVEYMAFPRLSALAENLWLPEAKKDWSRFTEVMKVHLLRLERLGAQPYRGALEQIG